MWRRRLPAVLVLCALVSLSQLKAEVASSRTNVILGRTVPLDNLGDTFEDENWHYDYERHRCCHGLWWADGLRGEPESLRRVRTPTDGKSGSIAALEMRTRDRGDDKHANQEDLFAVDLGGKSRPQLNRMHQPLFIVRVWLPPLERWIAGNGNYHAFGFRQAANSKVGVYYFSTWIDYNPAVSSEPYFVCRLGDQESGPKGPIAQTGWWTLATGFDESGNGYSYAVEGTDYPTEKDRICTTTEFTVGGLPDTQLDYIKHSFFSLGYPTEREQDPWFVIDDYEVWATKDPTETK